MNRLRAEAEVLRKQGYSYNLIHERLGVPKSTMSYWFRDMPFTPNAEVRERIKTGPGKVGIRRHNMRIEEVKRLKSQGIREVGTLSERDLWLVGIGIYIGEGAKTAEMIRVTNSDPTVIKLAMRWLQQTCGLSANDFSLRLHLYPDSDQEICQKYWQGVTGLSDKCMRRPSIDKRLNKSARRVGKLPYGTAHLTVVSGGNPDKGVRLFRRLQGWMTGVMDQV